MSQYLLATHVHLCVTDDHVVLLDLKRDQYVGVGREQTTALQGRVKGWPALPQAGGISRASTGATAESLLAKMVDSGMLTTDAVRGKDAQPIVLPGPRSSLLAADPADCVDPFELRPAINARHVLNFIRAWAAARLALRFRSIAAIVARVAARKARHLAAAGRLDLQAARGHVATYVHLRPLLFGARDACLFDSLTLVNFLARYRVFPTWVFGVQTGPFAAHCWVQHDGIVFNDTPEHVRRYTPLLAV